MKKSRRFFLDIHEHISIEGLLQSTQSVLVDDNSALFDLTKPEAVVRTENFSISVDDLARSPWIGERTLVVQDRTVCFNPKTPQKV